MTDDASLAQPPNASPISLRDSSTMTKATGMIKNDAISCHCAKSHGYTYASDSMRAMEKYCSPFTYGACKNGSALSDGDVMRPPQHTRRDWRDVDDG